MILRLLHYGSPRRMLPQDRCGLSQRTDTAFRGELPAPNSEDLLNLAAIETFKHNGTVYAVEPTEVQENKTLAAIMRY